MNIETITIILALPVIFVKKLYRWIDRWIYARKWTKCEKCGKRAFCYYGVVWPVGDDNSCGMGCPACKQERIERSVKEVEVLVRKEELRRAARSFVNPPTNRRAAVMATRKLHGNG